MRCVICDFSPHLESVYHSGTTESTKPRKFKRTDEGLICSMCDTSIKQTVRDHDYMDAKPFSDGAYTWEMPGEWEVLPPEIDDINIETDD